MFLVCGLLVRSETHTSASARLGRILAKWMPRPRPGGTHPAPARRSRRRCWGKASPVQPGSHVESKTRWNADATPSESNAARDCVWARHVLAHLQTETVPLQFASCGHPCIRRGICPSHCTEGLGSRINPVLAFEQTSNTSDGLSKCSPALGLGCYHLRGALCLQIWAVRSPKSLSGYGNYHSTLKG